VRALGSTAATAGIFLTAAGGGLVATLRPHSFLDASFVSFRYARHLAAGDGLVFNLGERVEGFSDPLWTTLLGGLAGLGLSPTASASGLGIMSLILIVLVVGWIGTRLLGEEAGVLASVLIACWPPVILAARSGGDVLFQGFLLTWTVGLLVSERVDGVRSSWASLALVLTSLTGLLGGSVALALVLLGAFSVPERFMGRLVLVLGTLGTLCVARWWYFDDVVPNYLWALWGNWGGSGRWAEGADWLLQLLRESPVLAGLGLAGAGWALLRRRHWRVPALVVLAVLVVVIGTAPERVLFWQPLMPILPIVALLGAGLLVDLNRNVLVSRTLLLAAALTFAAQDFSVAHERYVKVDQARQGRFLNARALGRFLALRFPENEVIAMHKPGVIGHFLPNPIIDLSGGMDRHVARTPSADLLADGKPFRWDLEGVVARDPAAFVHPKVMTSAQRTWITPPAWYPASFMDQYASVALTSRKHWDLTDGSSIWVVFFLRSGLTPVPDWMKRP